MEEKKFNQIEYNNEYNKKNYVGIAIRVRQEERDLINAIAKKEGISVTKLLMDSVKKIYNL